MHLISPVVKSMLIMSGILMIVLCVEWYQVNKNFGEEEMLADNISVTSNVDPLIPEWLNLSKDSYAVITREPLFTEGRKPLKSEEATPLKMNKNKQPKIASKISLVGVSLSNEQSLALLKDTKGKYHRLVVGDALEGWTIKSIKKTTINVYSAGKNKTIALEKHKVIPGRISRGALPKADLIKPPITPRIKKLPLHRGAKK